MSILITCKMGIMRLGVTSVIRDLFPNTVLLYAGSRRECLRILRCEKVRLMISDGTVDRRPHAEMVRKIRALQPDIKIVMLLEGMPVDQFRSIGMTGEIDKCIGKNAPIERIHEAILHVLSEAEA